MLKTLAEPACDQRLEGGVMHNGRGLSNFLSGSARLKSLEPPRPMDQYKGRRHCSIGRKDSHVKSRPGSELALASDRPVHGEDQGRGCPTSGARADCDPPVKVADHRLDNR